MRRVTKYAVYTPETTPMLRVTAKPWIGPTPKEYRIAPTKKVVMFASKMADRAFPYPPSMAAF